MHCDYVSGGEVNEEEKTAETSKASASDRIPAPLTKDNIVDFQKCHARNEVKVIDRSLITFLQIYETEHASFNKYRLDGKLNDSTRFFLLAIIFLRNYMSHNRQLYVTPDDRTSLNKEVLGLMVSILQVVMNAKRVKKTHQLFLRDIYLGEETRKCLSEKKLKKLKNGFQYSFPKLFISGQMIKADWFTADKSSEKVVFCSSDIDRDLIKFVTKCLVDLYKDDRQESYETAYHAAAIRALQSSGRRRKRRKRDP